MSRNGVHVFLGISVIIANTWKPVISCEGSRLVDLPVTHVNSPWL